VLAAARTEWVHHEERATVLDPWRVIFAVADGEVWSSEIAQGSEVGHHGRWVGIEGHFFTVIGPKRIAADLEQHFIGEHLFDDAASLDGLARIAVTRTAILVPAEHAAGHLAVTLADFEKIRVGRLQIRVVVSLLIELRRLA